jgi:hypothetical protein
VGLVLSAQLQADQQRVAEAMAHAGEWPEEWREVTTRHDTHVTLDPDQLAELRDELDELVARYRATTPGEGARRVSVVYTLIPTRHEGTP